MKHKNKKAVYLNDLPGFSWAAAGNNPDGYGKVAISGESFWLCDCHKNHQGLWYGTIANNLLCTRDHGLTYGQRVSFHIAEMKIDDAAERQALHKLKEMISNHERTLEHAQALLKKHETPN